MGEEVRKTQQTQEAVGNWIETFSGERIEPLNPRPEHIHMVDIVHALSNICRFTGHCESFYSVAQHSILVSKLVPDFLIGEALLHDAAEAYLCDIARPVKHQIPSYDLYERYLRGMIFRKYGVKEYDHGKVHPAVKEADDIALIFEAARLGFRWGAERMTPEIGKRIVALGVGRAEDHWPTPFDELPPKIAEQEFKRAIYGHFKLTPKEYYGPLFYGKQYSRPEPASIYGRRVAGTHGKNETAL